MMFLKNAEKVLEAAVFSISRWFNYIALAVIFFLMLLTVADVFGRWLFSRPVSGTFELTEIFLAMAVFFALSYALIQGSHIRIELLVSRLSRRAQAKIDCFNYLISLAVLLLIVWQMIMYAQRLWGGNVVSGVLSLPIYLFIIIAAIGFLVTTLIVLVFLLSSIRGVFTSNDS